MLVDPRNKSCILCYLPRLIVLTMDALALRHKHYVFNNVVLCFSHMITMYITMVNV